MDKWEYKISELSGPQDVDQLNELGAAGWEAVGITLSESEQRGAVLLKRIKPNPPGRVISF